MHSTTPYPSIEREKLEQSSSTQLWSAVRSVDQILQTSGLCARITLEGESVIVGAKPTASSTVPEFVFDKGSIFAKVFGTLRLIDFAFAYLDGQMTIGGGLADAIEVLDAINQSTDARQTTAEQAAFWLYRIAQTILPGAKARFKSLSHYEQKAEAYELFLDDYMQYTCGHFVSGSEDITSAQVAKFRLIEELSGPFIGSLATKDHLDIGCGWGGMKAYFESHLDMHSVGITNTPAQLRYAKSRFDVDVELNDFSILKHDRRRFDLVTIVGMMEHLVPRRRSELLKIVRGILKEDGVVYLQCIAKPPNWIGGDAYRFAQRVVFPGHFVEDPAVTEDRIRRLGFEILFKRDDGRDYGLTTARWVERLEQNRVKMSDLVGERQYRLFVGYLAYASRLFSTGRGTLMRYLLRPRRASRG